MASTRLSVTNHDRDAAGMTYVYPVVSRRARGVSVGVNLNPNDACNWRCVYCQVPNLKPGKAPPLDLPLLTRELHTLLRDIVEGDFLETRVPDGFRRLNDVALSGNGEPTTSTELADVVELIGAELQTFGLRGAVKIVLITNGSMMGKAFVRAALRTMAELNGEVWFKLDAGTAEGFARINGATTTPEQHLDRLAVAASLCPTWIQSCFLTRKGVSPTAEELGAYLECLRTARDRKIPVRGVLLYSLARPSLQPEAAELTALPQAWLEALARRIEALGLPVKVSP